jgi:hypothetical protein
LNPGPSFRATDFILAVISSQGPSHEVWIKATRAGLPFNDESEIGLPFWSVRLAFGSPSAGLTVACCPALPSSARAASGSANASIATDPIQAAGTMRLRRKKSHVI